MVRRAIRDTLQGLLQGESMDALVRERDAWKAQALKVQHEYMQLLEQDSQRASQAEKRCEAMREACVELLRVLDAQGGYLAPEHQAVIYRMRQALR